MDKRDQEIKIQYSMKNLSFSWYCTLICRRLLCVKPFCGLAITGSDDMDRDDASDNSDDDGDGDNDDADDDDDCDNAEAGEADAETDNKEAGIGLACTGDGAGGGAKSHCEVTAYCRVTVRVACTGEKFFKCPARVISVRRGLDARSDFAKRRLRCCVILVCAKRTNITRSKQPSARRQNTLGSDDFEALPTEVIE